ncbi:MAG: GNAT family N-acetyltransferase [Desulfobacterales bacterium]|nr:GNAT family N-acetyltransferase [Desulfobacterales bacterium]
MTSLTLTPYTFNNREIARALYQALTEDPFYITLEQHSASDREAAREAMFRYYDYALAEARDHGRLTLTPDERSGAAIWNCPMDGGTEAELSRKKKDFILDCLGSDSLRAYTEIVDFMSAQSADVVHPEFWYLSILGLSPDCQGQGMGKDLLAPVLKETDTLGVHVYAESFTPRNFTFYERLGFQPAKLVEEPVTHSQYAILVRPPQPLG